MNRNLFDIGNARYLLKRELVDTFIITDPFRRLLAPKNQIIIGSRGSGKTALLKILSHDHLSLLDNDFAKEIIRDKSYIGIHISTKTQFVGGLKNKGWQTEAEREQHFQWLMNIASCLALLETLKSCLNTYIFNAEDRLTKEVEIIKMITRIWFSDQVQIFSIDDLTQELEFVVAERSKENLRRKIYKNDENKVPIGLAFDMDLFDPLINGINIINRRLGFPEYTSWFVCIDEIEMLDEFHHRILNSYMRGNMGKIFFKFTTLPYCHYTLDTNLSVPLDIRHDVHYVYIDQDISFQYRATESTSNALKLFRKRAEISKPDFAHYKFQELFGGSNLLDRRNINYSSIKDSKAEILTEAEVIEAMNREETLRLFLKHTNEMTKMNGLDLLKQKKVSEFGDQFGRKLRALLYLKEYESSTSGKKNVELYCGAKTVINVGDANPRKLIAIFNEMLGVLESERYNGQGSKNEDGAPVISFSNQNLVLASLAEREINRFKMEKNFGSGLYDFINSIGKFMHDHIHKNKINLEQISSIEINKGIREVEWKLIERAVQRGLIYPNINIENPDHTPLREGVFHLAFILAPKFKLLPRKGDSRVISSILSFQQLTLDFDA